MLIPGSQLLDTPVLSLQTGGEIARTERAIINPDNLYIVAFELSGSQLAETPSFLRIEDIRELSELGMIIDSHDELVGLDDVITLKNLYQENFEIGGLKVVDDSRQKLGKVDGTVVNPANFIVQQINVKRPLLKSLNDTEILINRTQILNVTNKEITVKTTATKLSKLSQRYNYANPFRKPAPQSPQPETSQAADN